MSTSLSVAVGAYFGIGLVLAGVGLGIALHDDDDDKIRPALLLGLFWIIILPLTAIAYTTKKLLSRGVSR